MSLLPRFAYLSPLASLCLPGLEKHNTLLYHFYQTNVMSLFSLSAAIFPYTIAAQLLHRTNKFVPFNSKRGRASKFGVGVWDWDMIGTRRADSDYQTRVCRDGMPRV